MTTGDDRSVTSKSSKKRNAKKKKARHWTYCVETLKNTINEMYEICRKDQSVAGCKEATLLLQNGANDFTSLIATINVEQEYSNHMNQKRQSVAWEVRKSMCSPNALVIGESSKNLLPLSTLLGRKQDEQVPEMSSSRNPLALTYAQITAAMVAVAEEKKQEIDNEGWQLVSRGKRVKSETSTTVSEFDESEDQQPKAPKNVYERLSSSSYRRLPQPSTSTVSAGSQKLTCPRSAMDLPQTKASMAKMAYSRQLLWEKTQHSLVEKLKAKKKKEKIESRAKARSEAQKQCEQRKSSLQSINESGELDHNLDGVDSNEAIPSDPEPMGSIVSCPPSIDESVACQTKSSQASELERRSLKELETDAEWREVTEEEKSLALEERSLNYEIQKEHELSIDAELERQVAAEAEKIERAEKKKEKRKKASGEDMREFYKVFKEEIDSIATVALTELMHRSVARSVVVHEPGNLVEKHERMISPSRRRCQKDDDDFGKKHEEKLRKAVELRTQLLDEKAARVKELTNRVEEIRTKQERVRERKRELLKDRMRRAEENREKNIAEIVRRAEDDGEKVHEIQCLNTLMKVNKLQNFMMKDACNEEKQKHYANEKAKAVKEKAAKRRQQEEAATRRRKTAAMEKEEKTRNPQEDAELEPKPSLSEKTEERSSNSVEMLLTFAKSVSTLKELEFRPSGRRWDQYRTCKLCVVRLNSELEAVAHILSEAHINKLPTIFKEWNVAEIKKQIEAMEISEASIDSTNLVEGEEERENETLSTIQRLTKMQIEEAFPLTLTSPREQKKHIKEFSIQYDKISKMKKVDLPVQKSFEAALTSLVVAYENERSAGISLTVEQFLSIDGAQKLLSLLLTWTQKEMALRTCIKLVHTVCVMIKDVRIAYSIIHGNEFIKMISAIRHLLSTNPSDLQLSSLLSIMAECLRTGISREKEQKISSSPFRAYDNRFPLFLDRFSRCLNAVIPSSLLDSALTSCTSRMALISRLIQLAQLVVNNEHGKSFFMSVIKSSSTIAYAMWENQEKTDLIKLIINGLSGLNSERQILEDLTKIGSFLYQLKCFLQFELKRRLDEGQKTSSEDLMMALDLIVVFATTSKDCQLSCQVGPDSLTSSIANLPVYFFIDRLASSRTLMALIAVTENCPNVMKKTVAPLVNAQFITTFIEAILESRSPSPPSSGHYEKLFERKKWKQLLQFYKKFA